jgi:hypothetical protein
MTNFREDGRVTNGLIGYEFEKSLPNISAQPGKRRWRAAGCRPVDGTMSLIGFAGYASDPWASAKSACVTRLTAARK